MKLIDLSRTIEEDMPVYPGDEKIKLFQSRFLSANGFNDHRLEISMHTGTHIDSPMHLTERNEFISEVPIEAFIADGCLLDVRGEPDIGLKPIYEKIIPEECILILYTGTDEKYGTPEYFQGPAVEPELVELFKKKRIKMLGIDAPSIDRFPFPIHKLLFKNDIYVIENLMNLRKLVGVKQFEVMAFPLKIKADSTMARVIARI